MSPQQQLVHQLTDLAMAISLSQCAIVTVEYSSIANVLRVIVRRHLFEKPTLDESIQLHEPGDSELTRRRIESRLQQIITTLQAVKLRGEAPLPPAA